MKQDIWSTAVVDRLKALVAGTKYYSNAAIAFELNTEFGIAITRNAVIGKKGRLGMSGREPPQKPRETKPARDRKLPPLPRKAKQFVPLVPRSHTAAERIQARCTDINEAQTMPHKSDSDIPMEQRCTILDLDDSKCRWPVGEPGTPGFFFCGGKAVEGLPYCGPHCRRAFNPRIAVVRSKREGA